MLSGMKFTHRRIRSHISRTRRLACLSAAAAVLGSLLSLSQAAPAAAAPAALDPLSVGGFELTRDQLFTDEIAGLEETGKVKKAAVTDVLGARTGRPALCHNTGLNGALKYDGFCWDEDDDRNDYSDKQGGWMPQGFAGSHDATAAGTYQGRHLYVASWYFGKHDKNGPNEEYARVSIVQSTGAQVRYGHVALVEPTKDGFQVPKYANHTDGIAWYGDKLLVANGAELQVYDLRHLWKMDSNSARTGIQGGAASARYHNWALPMVARYKTYDFTNPRACGPSNGKMCLSTASIDRSKATHALVTGENYTKGGERIIRWSLSQLGKDGAYPQTVKPLNGYTTPVWNMQGVATDGSRYYMSGDCPKGWPANYSCLHVAEPGKAPHVLTQIPWLTQNLSWAPQSGRLWGVNEALGMRRVVFSINPHAGGADGQWKWLANTDTPGSVCATPQGNSTADGTPVTVWNCNGSSLQRWTHRSDGRLVHRDSGKCLTPKGDASGTNGTVLTLWTCNSSAPSQVFDAAGNTLTTRSGGKAITNKGGSFAKGTWLTLWTKAQGLPAEQKWNVKTFS